MNGKEWSAAEIVKLKKLYPNKHTEAIATILARNVRSVYNKATHLGLKKSDAFLKSPESRRLQPGHHIGKKTQYQKGHVPANKGLRRPGWSPGNMSKTQFKPGVMQGRAAAIYKPVGSTRITKDGYLEVKINEDLPFNKRWRAAHILLWEEELGPLPAGHMLCFKNGDKTDIRCDNLMLMSRSERMRLNSYHTNYPKDICQLIQLRAQIVRQINKRNTNEEPLPRSA